jgi:membrane protease YdiL (CAAX protease family)
MGKTALLILLGSIPPIYILTGYAVYGFSPVIFKSLVTLVFGLFGIVARNDIVNKLFHISPRPLITSKWKILIGGIVAYFTILNTEKVVVAQSILNVKALSSLDTITTISLLIDSGVFEEVLFRYLFFTVFFLSGILLFRNYYAGAITGIVLSSIFFYAFHYFVYGDVSQVALYVLYSGFILGGFYFLTANLAANIGIHVTVDVLPLLNGVLAIILGFAPF